MIDSKLSGNRLPLLALFVTALLMSGAILIGRVRESNEPVRRQDLNCSHWAVYHLARCCGISSSIDEIGELLTPRDSGNSLAEIRDALQILGVRTKGIRVSLADIDEEMLPCVVHLSGPAHFVVATRFDNETLFLFDPHGVRKAALVSELAPRWTGNVLTVVDTPNMKRSGPAISFASLTQEQGFLTPAFGQVSFEFPVRNVGDDLLTFEVITDCSCKVVTGNKQTLQPGEVGKIEVKYSVNPVKSHFVESVVVTSNDILHPHVRLDMAGSTPGGMRVSVRSIDFGVIRRGRRYTRTFSVTHSANYSLDDLLWRSEAPWLSVISNQVSQSTGPTDESASVTAAYTCNLNVDALHSGTNSTELLLVHATERKVLARLPVTCFRP